MIYMSLEQDIRVRLDAYGLHHKGHAGLYILLNSNLRLKQ